MPCWYFDKKELIHTPSYIEGIPNETEARYRREGARFIIDAGTKLGLSYETCATGVVYFHRFYMVHSFKEFHRYVMGACCLFLAGKVEETPKKCRDIIRIARTMLSDQQYSVFGEDPREEVMTMERVLLQTIKFDFQVDHPYSFLLKYAKLLKGDKQKIQKMVQMGWTFINDSLCTSLCLQWEPEIISVSLMYLASRLSKYEISDWNGKQPGTKTKWYEFLVEGITMELLEDVCHQVLDLYSSTTKTKSDSPTAMTNSKDTKVQPKKSISPLTVKQLRTEETVVTTASPQVTPASNPDSNKAPTVVQHTEHSQQPQGQFTPSGYTYNPYVSTQMTGASFLSQEGSQNIQTLMGGYSTQAPAVPTYNPPVSFAHQPPVATSSYPYPQPTYQAPYQQPPPHVPYQAPGIPPPPHHPPPQSYPPHLPPDRFPPPHPPNTGFAPITGPLQPLPGRMPPPPQNFNTDRHPHPGFNPRKFNQPPPMHKPMHHMEPGTRPYGGGKKKQQKSSHNLIHL